MASLTVRQLDDRLKKLLRLRAARNGRSVEEEIRTILKGAAEDAGLEALDMIEPPSTGPAKPARREKETTGAKRVLLILSGGYDQLFTYVIFASWILYGMATASVIVLRRKRPDLARPYRAVGYPFIPIVFVLVATALILSTLQKSPRESLLGLGIMATGIPFYMHWKRKLSA